MHRGFDFVDEVWTATEFVAQSLQAIGRKPVHTIPLPVPIPVCSPDVTRESLRLPASFMFLFMFDFFSTFERKNPAAVISAFSRAFRPGEGPILVIKTINGDSRLNDLEKLRAAVRNRTDVLIVDEYYSSTEKNSLLGLCDCYVSLHRSEGFGLTMAEAMGLGKPVIATAYSGNLHFMRPENSYLVDYTRVPVGVGCEPYPPGSPWADPSIDQAAELMRRVYEAREEAASKARRARHDILTHHNVQVTAAVLKQRLDAIGRVQTRRGLTTATRHASSGAATSDQEAPITSLDQLAAQLTPTPSVAAGRRFRAPLVQAQRLLFKVLRPYWFQQRHIQASLLHALKQLADVGSRASAAESAQRQSLQVVSAEVHTLRSEIASLKRAMGVKPATAENARKRADDRAAK